MSRKTKIFEEVIGVLNRELGSSQNREALEERGRRLLARIEGGGNDTPEERREGGEAPVKPRRPAVPKSLGSRIGGAVALLVGGVGLLTVFLLALFTFLAAPGMDLAYSEWLLPALVPVSVLAALPAIWLSVRGGAGLFGAGGSSLEAGGLGEDHKEKELLGAMERRGELTPARAAMETSLTVAESDRMLGEFANKGYLVARVNAGSLVYGLWDRDPLEEKRAQSENDKREQQQMAEGTDEQNSM